MDVRHISTVKGLRACGNIVAWEIGCGTAGQANRKVVTQFTPESIPSPADPSSYTRRTVHIVWCSTVAPIANLF